jgi:hypothetical protein
MQVEFTRKFGKQVAKCKDSKIKVKLYLVIHELSKAQDLDQIKHLKKLKGHQSIYKSGLMITE